MCWIGSKLCEVPGYVHMTGKQVKAREEKKFRDTERAAMESLIVCRGLVKPRSLANHEVTSIMAQDMTLVEITTILKV